MNTQAGQLSIPNPNPNACQTYTGGVSCLTDSNGIATVDFTTTRQPGDNFTVAASANQTYLEGLTLAADGINLIDTNSVQTPVTTTTANGCATSSVRACRAEMLTVWRRLHIEVDSMGNSIQNFVAGTITDTKKVGTGNQTINLSVNNLQPNRFENGRIVIQGSITRSLSVIDATFNPNTGAVIISSNSANSVTIHNNGGAFNVNNGDLFKLYDDDDFNDNDTVSLIGDTGEDIPEPPTYLMQSTDTLCNGMSATGCNVFASMYVRPVYDITADTTDNTIFQSNIIGESPEDINSVFVDFDQAATEASEEFWTVYLYGAYQKGLFNDGDPSEDNGFPFPLGCPDATYGSTDDFSPAGIGTIVFMEVGRPTEYPPDYASRPVSRAWTAAHEIGHLLGGDHDDLGIMSSSCIRSATGGYLFSPATISRLRKIIRHP